MDIHFDPLGGWSGDMFAAAMLDAFPEAWPDVQAAVAALDLGPDAGISLLAHRDRAFTGKRFVVASEILHPAHGGERHSHHIHVHDDAQAEDHHHHHHRPWRDIRSMLQSSPLRREAKDQALAIFRHLAEAEAQVHGVTEDEVTFHEVGAIDSIVDIVAAGVLIAHAGTGAWTAAPLPLGAGRVMTQHGILPVPTPATALLLQGLATIDDGIPGERVTPTGAAIARHLLLGSEPVRTGRRLVRSGTGFGTRTMPAISNCLRVLAYEPASVPGAPGAFAHRQLAVVTFEVDDCTAEHLATGLDHLRASAGVHDVLQSVAYGKKGRIATHVRVLAVPDALEAVIAACFQETTTIGLRYHLVEGAVLPRTSQTVEVDGRALRVKIVERSDGRRTAKAEASDVAPFDGHATRMRLCHDAEAKALSTKDPT